jgi:hypothetical protein
MRLRNTLTVEEEVSWIAIWQDRIKLSGVAEPLHFCAAPAALGSGSYPILK